MCVNPIHIYYVHTDPSIISKWCSVVTQLSYHVEQLNLDIPSQLSKILTRLQFECVQDDGQVELSHFMSLFQIGKEKRKVATEILEVLNLLSAENKINFSELDSERLWEFYARFVIFKIKRILFQSIHQIIFYVNFFIGYVCGLILKKFF